jgi:cytochrome c6
MNNRHIFIYFSLSYLLSLVIFSSSLQAMEKSTGNFYQGKELFFKNCAVCHNDGNNIIIPEKNLKKDALEENGMNSITAISYQILNGKNGMPAFEERLNEYEIELIASYVLEESKHNFLP